MTNKLLLIFEILYLTTCVMGCVSQQYLSKGIGIEGTFISKNDTAVKLIIEGDKFTLLDSRKTGHLALLCCDTITFGKIHLDNHGILVLNSDPSLNSIFIPIEVTESRSKNSDSVIFYVRNRIDGEYRQYNTKGGDLIYTMLVQPSSNSIDHFKENNQPFESSTIRYYNPGHLGIDNFKVTIVPKQSIAVRTIAVEEIHTLEYAVKDKKSNIFEINIPQLSYGFISYRRLNDDYAKMIDKNSILWEGKEFVRQDK